MKLVRMKANAHVAVCVPCRDQVHSMFTWNLAKMLQGTKDSRLTLLMEVGSLISRQRQNLARSAIELGASHILWLDSDMMFPLTIVETLLAHDQDVVACNYSTRTVPLKGVAYTKVGDWDSWLGYGITLPKLVEVEAVGMGCMLTKSSVFNELGLPWFEIAWSDEHGDHIGEDFYFCKKIREKGHRIMIDTVASREIKHLGTNAFQLSLTSP